MIKIYQVENLSALVTASQTQKTFFAAPNAANGSPLWRFIIASDIPTLNQDTTGSAAKLTTPRTIGMTGDVTWSGNFDGSGNVTAAATLANSGATAGTYKSVTVDAKGRVTSGTTPTTLAGYSISDAYTKSQVDAIITGLDFKQSVRAATTGNITLTALQTVDGISLLAGERVFVKNQTTKSENGIYVVASGSWTRATDAVAGMINPGMYCFVEEGTTNADSGWVLTTNGTITVGTTGLDFTQFNGLGQILAGTGLTKDGNTLNHSNSVTAGTVEEGGVTRTLAYGNTFNVPKFTFDAQGHINGTAAVVTLTLPAAPTIAQGTRTGTTVPVTITGGGSGATLSAADGTYAGVMSNTDKSKLDDIAAGAQVNVATNLGFTVTASAGTVTNSNGTAASIPGATTGEAGLMSATDKTKLNGLSNYTLTAASASGTVASGTAANTAVATTVTLTTPNLTKVLPVVSVNGQMLEAGTVANALPTNSPGVYEVITNVVNIKVPFGIIANAERVYVQYVQ